MGLLFDQNLSHRLVSLLAVEYPGSEHVRSVGLADADDEIVWDFARDHGHVIVSKDVDFFHRSMLRGHPPKVIWLRVGNGPTSEIERLLRVHHGDLSSFIADPRGAFLTLPPEI